MSTEANARAIRETLSAVPEMPDGAQEPAPLAAYKGEHPFAPAWFTAAIADTPTVGRVDVAGVGIETLVWGKPSDPGVVLLHGNGAHAGWWRGLAPAIAASGRRVVALSFSGMGGSDWRAAYTMDVFSQEIVEVASATGLLDTGARPALIGHSFGGFPALHTATTHAEHFSSLIMLDSSIEPPGEEWTGPPKRSAPNRVYPTMADALARFRLAPPQPCDNHWMIDQIARESLKPVDGGWTWRFDPFLWNAFDFGSAQDLPGRLSMPSAVVRGAQSWLMGPRTWNHMRTLFPASTAFVTVPQARHHLMLDEPIAVIATLDALLSAWGQ
jgi:pimeloyl-ACP methyl ester carboxylesterase